MYLVSTPTEVIYEARGRELVFPAAIYAGLDINHGHVVGLKLSPHLKYLDLEGSVSLAQQMNDLLRKAGWQRSPKGPELDSAAVREAFDKDHDTPKKIAVAMWEDSGDSATILITHQHKADDAFAKLTEKAADSFIVTVDFENETILRTY
jgi:hypothetical protein